MQQFQSDLRCPAAKDNSITHAAAAPSNLQTLSCKTQKTYAQKRYQNDAWSGSSTAGPIRPWSEHRDRLGPVRRKSFPHTSSETRFVLQKTGFRASAIWQKRISCETPFKFQVFKLWKRSFRERLPSNSNGSSFENEAFVRDILQIPSAQALKTKLSCGTSFRHPNFQRFKLRHPDFQTFKLSDIQTLIHSNF